MGIRVLIALLIGLVGSASSSPLDDYSKAILKLNPKLSQRESRYISNKIVRYAHAYNLDPALICAIIAVESRFNPTAVGGIGEIGLMQLRPQYHANHIDDKMLRTAYLFDVQMNLSHGISYLAQLKSSYKDRYPGLKWVEKYNIGPHNKPTTYKYLKKVLKYYALFKGSHDL